MRNQTAITVLLCTVLACGLSTPATADSASVQSMLTDWVEDFRHDAAAAVPATFGVRIKDAQHPDWHVVVTGQKTPDSLWSVELNDGLPETPCGLFVTDMEHLTKLHIGELASLTAMGKAFSTDFAPLDFDGMEGWEPSPDDIQHLIRLAFHFWTRGFPEVIPFGDLAQTRVLHGANATLFYYQEGFRSGWFSIGKGQHVNADENSRINSFPTLVIITRGSTMARIGGVERLVKEGEAVYIGPGVSHEFWNDSETRGEGVLIMFGEGA